MVARIMSPIVSHLRRGCQLLVDSLPSLVEAAAPTASISSLQLPAAHVQVHSFHVAFCDIFVAQCLTAHLAVTVGQLSVENLLGDARVFHSHDMTEPSQLCCSQHGLNAFYTGSPKDLNV